MAEKHAPPSSLPGYGVLVVALALLFGVAPGRKGDEKKAETGTTPPAPTAVVGPEEPKAAQSGLIQFLKDRGVVDTSNGLDRPVPKTRFLILTLPDPVDSQFGYWYDQSLDALTRAMTDCNEGYSLADRWFPWAVGAGDKPKNRADRTAWTKTVRSKAEPGVMIYQRNGHADERMVVLVVGENPLSGLNVSVLRAALDLADQAPGNAEKPIPLVGPFFTGSQVSLGRTVRKWAEEKGRDAQVVTCITGTALGLKPWKELWPEPDWQRVNTLCGQIHGTSVPFEQLHQVAMHYLSRPGRMDPTESPTGYPDRPVAYLVEANSGFGEAATRNLAGLKLTDQSLEALKKENVPAAVLAKLSPILNKEFQRVEFEREVAQILEVAQIPTADEKDKVQTLILKHARNLKKEGMVFRFPMHIGRLAAMRSQDARARDERLGLIQPGDEQLLATDANRTARDLIPSADETRTALLNQRLLADFWTQIRREQVRYICVIATDTRDVLFLLEQLQDACPDARPIAFGADLHYVYPDYQRFMRGVLVVGTYPLFQPAQRWQTMDSVDRRRMPFPSATSEGVYNALLATLDSPSNMVDYRPPFGAASTQPPVWVTTIGENSEFVALAYSTGYEQPTGYDSPYLVRSEGKSGRDPGGSPFGRPFFYLVGFVVIATGVAARRVWTVDQRTAPALRAADARVWVPGLRAQYVTIVGVGGVFAVLPLVLAFGSARALKPREMAGLCAALAALVLVAVGTAWYVRKQAVLVADGVRAGSSLAPAYAILAPWQVVAFALLLGGTVVGWLLADHSRLPDAARWLFAERAGSIFSGCSPVVPTAVIALGLLGHGLMGLHHVRLLNEFRVAAPYPRWENDPPAGVASQDADAVGRIHAAVSEIDARFRNLLGVFAEPGQRTGTRWGRLLVWGTATALAGTVTYLAIFGGRVHDPILYGLGIALVTTAAVACARLLRFVWSHEGWVPVAWPQPTGLLLLVIAGAACATALVRAQLTWESRGWDCLFATGFLILAFLTLAAGYRIFRLWKEVEKITRAIAVIPMVAAFDRFPDKVSRVFGAYLLTGRRRTLDLAIPRHLLEQLRVLAPEARAVLQAVPDPASAGSGSPEELEGASADVLCGAAASLVSALAPGWGRQGLPDAFGTVTTEPNREAGPGDCRGVAEQFVAIMAVIFLSQYFARMRCLAYMMIAPAAALLLAVTAYQFDPEQYLMYTAVAFAGAVIALLVWLLYKINCNELVSRATRSTPNKFQLDSAFVQNLTVFVLPLAAVVVTQLAGRMRSVIEPVLGWIR